MRLECVGMHPIYIHPHPLSPPASPNLNSNNNNNSNSLNTGSAKNVEPQSSSFSRRGGREISYSQPRNGSRASRGSWWNYDGSLRHPIEPKLPRRKQQQQQQYLRALVRTGQRSYQNRQCIIPGGNKYQLERKPARCCRRMPMLTLFYPWAWPSRVPQRPCKYCDVMGHIGINCPEVVEVRAQKATGDLAPV